MLLIILLVLVIIGLLLFALIRWLRRPRVVDVEVERMRIGSSRSAMENTQFGRMVRGITRPVNQEDCNSCWAIATNQSMSDRLRLQGKISRNDQLNFYMFHDYVVSLTPEDDGCATGAYIDTGMDMTTKVGAPLMSQTRDRRFDDRYISSDTRQQMYRTRGWRQLFGVDAIKQELERNGSVVGIINLFDSFGDVMSSRPYVPRPGEQADPSMVHMVSVVGYDDRDNSWIVRNSYGTSWGFGGFVKIPYNNRKIALENAVYAPIL